MDTERLHANICSSLQSDLVTLEHLSTNSDPCWVMSPDGLLWLEDWIYIPDTGNLQLCILQYVHDHPLAGHCSQQKTLYQV